MKNNATKNLIQSLEDKYSAINQDKNVYLEGLLHSKTINYWDYIHTDALLNLQIQRTTLPDEMVFIGYHQINELLFKIISTSRYNKLTSVETTLSQLLVELKVSI